MARPKLGEGETERLHMKITADEIAAIDDWRYSNRVPSRSEAVRRLVQIAITIEPLIAEMRNLWIEVHAAEKQVSAAVSDAWANIDTMTVEENLQRIEKAGDRLGSISPEFDVHTAMMSDIVAALVSGADLDSSIAEMKKRMKDRMVDRQFFRDERAQEE